jgi:hypothetical protein
VRNPRRAALRIHAREIALRIDVNTGHPDEEEEETLSSAHYVIYRALPQAGGRQRLGAVPFA